MLLRFARDLSGTREIKRFVNVFRFYAYIDFWRRTQGLETPGLDGAGKLAGSRSAGRACSAPSPPT